MKLSFTNQFNPLKLCHCEKKEEKEEKKLVISLFNNVHQKFFFAFLKFRATKFFHKK
jgi:hypothetical protein